MSFLDKDKKSKLNDFVKFVKNELELDTVPTITIQNHRNGLKTTANYDYTKENKIIKVCSKNRALVDVMRSIAHELVHHKQFEQGRLDVRPPDIGGEIEDEANAKAGQFIKMFSKIDETIYDD
jgi:Zn-dependent peptidase ImmA (M78 family)